MQYKRLDIALFITRIVFGSRLIYGTIDNIISWERMLEFKVFLDSNGFPFPLAAAIVSVYAQFIAGISWIVGYKIHFTVILMMINFTIAIVGFHIVQGDTYLNTAPAIHLLCISILFYVTGAGQLSMDEKLNQKRS